MKIEESNFQGKFGEEKVCGREGLGQKLKKGLHF